MLFPNGLEYIGSLRPEFSDMDILRSRGVGGG